MRGDEVEVTRLLDSGSDINSADHVSRRIEMGNVRAFTIKREVSRERGGLWLGVVK